MEGYGIVVCDVSVLTPPGDPIISKLKLPTLSAPGGEEDVLLRYHHLANHTGADYIVRVTGDCPLLPPSVIVRHVNIATTNEYDYLSNVDERCRTAPDGYDCEVISRRLLTWLHESAKDASDREHVTTLARRAPPAWAKRGAIVSSLDLSAMKLSIDTEADFQSVENEAGKVDRALETAATLFGANVHRI
jgi:spore coat polysaccharide biosynthesis protein SpsF (cytidylyltransferase family)